LGPLKTLLLAPAPFDKLRSRGLRSRGWG
jgi:hypothetical protein